MKDAFQFYLPQNQQTWNYFVVLHWRGM